MDSATKSPDSVAVIEQAPDFALKSGLTVYLPPREAIVAAAVVAVAADLTLDGAVAAAAAAAAVVEGSENWRLRFDRIVTGCSGVDCVAVDFEGCAEASADFLAPLTMHPSLLSLSLSLQQKLMSFD